MESQSRFVRKFGDSPYYVPLVKAMAKIDLGMQKLTRGRVGLLTIGGFPNLLLTVSGRRSGVPRTVSLLYVPQGTKMIVVGSNFGQSEHPAWTANLAAAGRATVRIKKDIFEVRATLVAGPEREPVWEEVLRAWPDYEAYSERAGRELRLFVLTPCRDGEQRESRYRTQDHRPPLVP
jgi:deazaflavin-dependent oxidoreductase (nitroreductase family)